MTCPVPAHADGGYTQAQQISVMRLPAEQQVQNKDTYRSMLWGSTSRATATNRRLVYILPSCVYCRPWQAYAYRHTAKETGLHWNEAVLLTQSRKVSISTYIVYICMQQPNYRPPWYCSSYRTRKRVTRWLPGRSCVHRLSNQSPRHIYICYIYI